MKKLIVIGAVVLAVCILGGGSYALIRHEQPKTTSAATQTQPQSKITFNADKKTVDYDGTAGQTALETLKSFTNVTTKSTQYGEMVIAIHGMSADNTTNFWSFYVNGKPADVGAGAYKAANGDKIEWRLEKL